MKSDTKTSEYDEYEHTDQNSKDLMDSFMKGLTIDDFKALNRIHKLGKEKKVLIRFDWDKSIDIIGKDTNHIIDEDIFGDRYNIESEDIRVGNYLLNSNNEYEVITKAHMPDFFYIKSRYNGIILNDSVLKWSGFTRIGNTNDYNGYGMVLHFRKKHQAYMIKKNTKPFVFLHQVQNYLNDLYGKKIKIEC